jgi:hypothetical protein
MPLPRSGGSFIALRDGKIAKGVTRENPGTVAPVIINEISATVAALKR